MNDEPTYYASITAKYKDSNAIIRFADFKSKKKGSTFNQLFAGLTIAGYQSLTNGKVSEWWAKGIVHKNISRLREIYVDSEGRNGISRMSALRVYKVILPKLTMPQLKSPIVTFDRFTMKELGLEDIIREHYSNLPM